MSARSGEVYDVVKAGYLGKEARKSKRNWKRRYFILHSSALTYFESHTSLNKAKGDLMLNTESTTEAVDIDGKFRLVVSSSFSAGLTLEASTREERDQWVDAINGVVAKVSGLLRGYIIKQGGLLAGGHKRLFFVLHRQGITCHSSHERTADILDTMHLHAGIAMECKDDEFVLQFTDVERKGLTWSLQFDVSGEEYMLWKDKTAAILQLSLEKNKKSRRGSTFVATTKSSGVFTGHLWVIESGGKKQEVNVDPYFTILTMDEATEETDALLVFMQNDSRVDGGHVFKTEIKISSACGVCEANRDDTFVIVSPDSVVKLQAKNKQEKEQWIFVIREVIYDLHVDVSDPMLVGSDELFNNPVYVDLNFESKAPLGIGLERIGEWPVVEKIDANKMGSEVVQGDILYAVDGSEVLLEEYDTTISKLLTWQPPLQLRFLHLPEKAGYLSKRSLHEASKWRTRYFHLTGGRLNYRRLETEDNHVKGEIVLYGASVSLIDPADADGKLFCVRIQAGERGIVIQAETEDERVDWAIALHYSAWMLNGSSQIAYTRRKEVDESRAKQLEAEEESQRVMREAQEAAAVVAAAAAMEEARRIQEETEAQAQAQAEAAAIAAVEEEAAAICAAHEELMRAKDEEAEAAKLALAGAGSAPPPPPPPRTVEDEEEYLDGLTIFELQEEATATIDDLQQMFSSYSKIIKRQQGAKNAPGVAQSSRSSYKGAGLGSDPRLMNPMGFVALYRLASSGKSKDLFKEMKLFNSFDLKDRGHLDEQDFVDGWKYLEQTDDPRVLRQLRELKKLTMQKKNVVI